MTNLWIYWDIETTVAGDPPDVSVEKAWLSKLFILVSRATPVGKPYQAVAAMACSWAGNIAGGVVNQTPAAVVDKMYVECAAGNFMDYIVAPPLPYHPLPNYLSVRKDYKYHYYNPAPNFETFGLLVNGASSCGGWARFFTDLALVHGIKIDLHAGSIVELTGYPAWPAGLYGWGISKPDAKDRDGDAGPFSFSSEPNHYFWKFRDHAYNGFSGKIYDLSLSMKKTQTWEQYWFYESFERFSKEELKGYRTIDQITTNQSLWIRHLKIVGRETTSPPNTSTLEKYPDPTDGWPPAP